MAEGNIGKKYIPIKKEITVTTSYSGAVTIPNDVKAGTFICAYGTSRALFVFRRDINYLMVKNSETLEPVTESEENITIVYIP